MGCLNRKRFFNLGITHENTSIKTLYLLLIGVSIPHLLKLTRNHLLHEGYQLVNGKKITKYILVNLGKSTDLKFAYKTSESHLLVT